MTELKAVTTQQGAIHAFNWLTGVAQQVELTGTAKSFTVNGANSVRIFSNKDAYLKGDATAELPDGDVTSGASIPIGGGSVEIFDCSGLTTISVISASTAEVTAVFKE